jgi:hypothetical protein
VRWPLTFPARPLLGSLVTDQYHRASEIALALDEPGLTYPTELAEELRSDPGDVASAETSDRPSFPAPATPATRRSRWTGSTSRSPIASTRAARRRCSRCACRASTR